MIFPGAGVIMRPSVSRAAITPEIKSSERRSRRSGKDEKMARCSRHREGLSCDDWVAVSGLCPDEEESARFFFLKIVGVERQEKRLPS